ncbi:response regulator [Sporosarcina sp. resist]|uniref:BTAD domain-containing protein n=1 Tax=Sporosarcina sp. resist TaxID=2762563 RepID=UPI00164E97F2|nr:BTAD domain-containing protein [Sporosarcina sp. resist]QNK89164.1 response regulator [Sporosarcina sp. resist]
MRVLLIDDEELALKVNEKMLSEVENVEVVGKFTDPYLALKEMETLQTDVVFLDMEMTELHGLEVAEMIMSEHHHIEILFVTAYPQYAVEAFDVNAIDYLLKPINKVRLKKAIKKTQEKLDLYNSSKEIAFSYAHTMGSFYLLDTKQNIVKWRTKKVKELLLYLGHHRGYPVHKSIVVEQLWPEADAEKAFTLLHSTVYQLRKTLKESGIENSVQFINDHYALNVFVQSDYADLEQLIKSKEMNTSIVEQVLTLYQGDFLEEEEYNWSIQSQRYLKNSVLQFLEKVILTEEHATLKEKCLEKMLELDMYNETYMYKLLEHYIQAKNKEKIDSLNKLIKTRLSDDLGIEIPFANNSLYTSIEK